MCFCSLMRMNPTMFTERETSMREKPIAEVYPQTNKSFHGSHNPRRMEIVMCKAELVLCIDLFTYCFSCWNSGEKVFPQEKIFSSCLILFMVEQSYSRCSKHTHTHARTHTHTLNESASVKLFYKQPRLHCYEKTSHSILTRWWFLLESKK